MPQPLIPIPDETAYHKSQVEYEEKIASLNDKIRELGERFTEKV